MSETTRIAWTDATWSPVVGCSHVSPACENCYAEAMARRFGWTPKPWTAANASENVTLHPERLTIPLHWKRPRRIFVCSVSDLFHEQVPDEFIDRVFAVMWLAKQHTFQVLTKRPQRMQTYLSDPTIKARMDVYAAGLVEGRPVTSEVAARFVEHVTTDATYRPVWPIPNVWLGVTAEDQRRADERISLLLQTPAALRFVSIEPMLGPVRLSMPEMHEWPAGEDYVNRAWVANPEEYDDWKYWQARGPGIRWVIAGAESGPHARPMDVEWVRDLRDQCQASGVSFFYKQAMTDGKLDHEPMLDGQPWRQFPVRS